MSTTSENKTSIPINHNQLNTSVTLDQLLEQMVDEFGVLENTPDSTSETAFIIDRNNPELTEVIIFTSDDAVNRGVQPCRLTLRLDNSSLMITSIQLADTEEVEYTCDHLQLPFTAIIQELYGVMLTLNRLGTQATVKVLMALF